MENPTLPSDYNYVVFLKDPSDKVLLRPRNRLYGKIVHSCRTVFLTPYPPPTASFPVLGVIKSQSSCCSQESRLTIVLAAGESALLEDQAYKDRVEVPAKIIYMAASYARTPFSSTEMRRLWLKTAVIVGCGTGGSKLALELARAGVGHLKLCDPEKLDFANICRHEGCLFDVGKFKTEVAAERVYAINPAIRLETYSEDIFKRPLHQVEQIINSDLVVAATDKTAKQLLINELTHRYGIPCVFGGCYEEARGGEVLYTLPGEKMPCLACLRAGLEQPEANHEVDYSTSRPEDYEAEPGLHAAIDFVTCPEVLICLAILLRKSPRSKLGRLIDPGLNFLLIGGALGKGFYRFKRPFHVFFQPLKGPRKNCPVCGDTADSAPDIGSGQDRIQDWYKKRKKEDS